MGERQPVAPTSLDVARGIDDFGRDTLGVRVFH